MSYGTQIGLAYAKAHPARLRALLLDGAVPPNQTLKQRAAMQVWGRLSTVDVFSGVYGKRFAMQVLFTRRPTPQLIAERDRAKIANTAGADLVLSLHVERVSLPGANGIATFYFGDPRGGRHSMSGREAAEILQDEICQSTDLTDCRSHARTWDLLRLTRMPAVWVELGYLSHPGDAARLNDPRFRDAVAEAIASATSRFFAPQPS